MKNNNKENVAIKEKGTRNYKSYRLRSNAEEDKRQRQKAWMLHRRDVIVIYPVRFTFYEVPKNRPFHGFFSTPDWNYSQKSWDTFAFLGRFPIHTGPTPPLTSQTMLDTCIQHFFRVSTLYRVGEGEL